MSNLYTDTVYALAAEIAEDEIGRLQSVDLMQCEPSIGGRFKELRALVRKERQRELDEMMASAHPSILEDFAADAGYLVGLEIGKRLGRE